MCFARAAAEPNTPCSEMTKQRPTTTLLQAVTGFHCTLYFALSACNNDHVQFSFESVGFVPIVFLPVNSICSLHLQATKAVKGTLNKLTPEKFERLLQQLVDVVTSADILHTTISLVFESAVAQPTFVAMYADLCDRLSKVCCLDVCSISSMHVDKWWSCKVQGRQHMQGFCRGGIQCFIAHVALHCQIKTC